MLKQTQHELVVSSISSFVFWFIILSEFLTMYYYVFRQHLPRCQWPAAPSPPPLPARTSTRPPSSSELEPLPSESPDLEPVSDPSSDLSSSATPATLPSSNSFSHTPSWDSPCPKPWVSSVWWWPSSSSSLSKHFVDCVEPDSFYVCIKGNCA